MATKIVRMRDRWPAGKDGEAQRVRSLVSEAQAAKRELEEEWYHAILFARGQQWSYLDPDGGGIQQIPRVPWRIRVTDNQTLPLITHMLALLIENRPTWKAIPRNEEEEDIFAAYGYEGLLAYDWERHRCTQLLADTLSGALTTGNWVWRIAWNPDGGKPVMVPSQHGEELAGRKDSPKEGEGVDNQPEEPEDEDFVLPDGTPIPPATPLETVFTGDVDIRKVSPFNFGIDLGAEDLHEAAWCYQIAWINREVLIDTFGSKAATLPTGGGEDRNYDQDLRYPEGVSQLTNESSEMVRVIEFWEAPSKKHPVGQVITVAGDTTLDVRPNPYEGRYPYVHFGANKVPGRVWRDGAVRHLIPLQQMHNKAISRYHELMNLMSNPKVIADVGALKGETSVNDQPGEVIFKKRGTEVRFESPPPAPSIHPQIMSMANNAMQSITGVNDPLAGVNPPNVRAGTTVRYLQEAGMRRFTPIALQIEQSIREAGQMLLHLHQRFYDEDRMIRVLGRDSRPEVHHLRRADIDRITDVTVEHGSLIPKSAAEQQDTMIQMLQFAPQLFADEQGQFDNEHVFRILDMPSASGRVSLDRRQRSRAYQEHIDAAEGQPITVMPFDNDMLHMRCHAGRLSDDAWVRENPQAYQDLMEHYRQHELQRMAKLTGQSVDIYGGGPGMPERDLGAPPAGDTGEGMPPMPGPSGPMGRGPGAEGGSH